jgi:hypothetical protein
MRRQRHRAIRGPTRKNATDHAGNAVGGGEHRGGSGINQPGRATSCLVPGLSVGREGASVKVARCVGPRGIARVIGAGAAGKRTGLPARAPHRTLPVHESGMTHHG